jgi:hypothetical protein
MVDLDDIEADPDDIVILSDEEVEAGVDPQLQQAIDLLTNP